MAALHDDSRGLIALGLGLGGFVGSTETLRDVVRDSVHRPDVLENATLGLALLQDDELTATLEGALEDCDCMISRIAIASGLGRTRRAAAVDSMLRLLADEQAQELERTAVVLALGDLAEKERQPWSARLSAGLQYLASPATLTGPAAAGILDLY